MSDKRIERLILQMENYVECWKQLNHYLNLARSKQFAQEDENQFLEVKSVIAQELEMLLSEFDTGSPTKEDVHTLLGSAPSIRFVSELNESSLRALENQWHKIFIAWQSILGQLKVQQRQAQARSLWGRISGRDS